jgi:hypothetical protein
MLELRDNGVVDAATHFERRHGRKVFAGKNASQISFGDASYNPFKEYARAAPPAAHDTPRTSADVSRQCSEGRQASAERRPMRRPRGPGTDFARFIEVHGFPTDASRRSARVDVAPETLYQYEPGVLHTHQKLTGMPFRSKQCDSNLQLFLRPEEALARATAAARRFQQPQRQQLLSLTNDTRGDDGVMHSTNAHPFMSRARTQRSVSPPLALARELCVGTTGCDGGHLANEAAQLQRRLQLLDALYAQEYARLQELSSIADGNEDGDDAGEGTLYSADAAVLRYPAQVVRCTTSDCGYYSHLTQRQRRTRSTGGVCCIGSEEDEEEGRAVEFASVPPGPKQRQRVVQPWEREYAQIEESLNYSTAPTPPLDEPWEETSAETPWRSQRSINGLQQDCSAHRDPTALHSSSAGCALHAVQERWQPVAPRAHQCECAECAEVLGRSTAVSAQHSPQPVPHATHARDAVPTLPPSDSPSSCLSSSLSQAGVHESAHVLQGVKTSLTEDVSHPHPASASAAPPTAFAPPSLPQLPTPPHPQQRGRDFVVQDAHPPLSRSFVASAGLVRSQPPAAAGFFTASTTKSLRDLCAGQQAHPLLLAEAVQEMGVPSSSAPQHMSAAPKKGSQTLRDVCRALQGPL